MNNHFSRSVRVFGESAIQTLSTCHVAIFGLGGVGGYAAEALVRSGIGREKTDVMKERMLSIP